MTNRQKFWFGIEIFCGSAFLIVLWAIFKTASFGEHGFAGFLVIVEFLLYSLLCLSIANVKPTRQETMSTPSEQSATLPTFHEYKEWQDLRPDLSTYEDYKAWLELSKGEENVADDGDVKHWSQDNG